MEKRICQLDIKQAIHAGDILEVALITSYNETLLPELRGIIGDAAFSEFMFLFGGLSIKFPTREEIAESLRDAEIFVSVETAQNKTAVLGQLADRHSLQAVEVQAIHKKVVETLDKRGIDWNGEFPGKV